MSRRPPASYNQPRTYTLTGIALAAGIAALPLTDSPAFSSPHDPAPSIRADYTVYVGGFIFAEGSMQATLDGEQYLLNNALGAAGLPGKLWDAKWVMTSEGQVDANQTLPSSFSFSAIEKDKEKQRNIAYDNARLPTVTFEPSQGADASEKVPAHLRQNTLDPVSAFLILSEAGENPCSRTLPIFDGKRRYDLQLSYEREEEITTRNKGYSGPALRCRIKLAPHAGTERSKVATMMQRREDSWVWLAPTDHENLYIPVRIRMRTPLGGAVLDVVKLEQQARKERPAAHAAE